MLTRDDLLIKVATFYYEANLTQTAISKRLNISRPTISNLLKEAREKGIVRITIQHSKMNTNKQQDAIAEMYNLQTVLVAPQAYGTLSNKSSVGNLCANFLEQRAMGINSLGIGWGTTMYEFVQAASYTSFSHLNIVPLMGGFGINDVKFHSNHLAFQLAEKYNCFVNYFYAPAITESIEVKKTFESTNLIQEIYNQGKKVDLAVVGVGNPIESSTYRRLGYISEKEKNIIKDTPVIGDVLATFFNRDGNPVSSSISNRMLGITLDDLEVMNEILLIASGAEKAASIKALLNKGFIDHLIIDKDIADELINGDSEIKQDTN